MSLDWSPADLGRQRRIVRALARRAETDRLRLQAKRRQLVDEVARTVSSPLGLVGCFLVGFVIGSARRGAAPRRADTRTAQQKLHPLRLLIGAWLWLRRSHALVVDTREPTVSRELPLADPDPPAALSSSESIH